MILLLIPTYRGIQKSPGYRGQAAVRRHRGQAVVRRHRGQGSTYDLIYATTPEESR